jgi:diacylglycerol kinase (ATP)
MSRKIIYLINPISGLNKKSSLKDWLSRKTEIQGIDYEIHPTSEKGDYRFLIQKIQQDSVTDIVICGGDGTVNPVAAALQGNAVNLGIIPLGSGNGLAFTAKIPKQANQALEIIFDGRSSWIDAFHINGVFSCMLCGVGFDARVAHEFAKEKRRGLNTYIKIAAIQFFKARPYPFEIITKEKSFHTEAFFISIANSNQFGNHFTIAPQASLQDGLLDIVIVKKMNKFKLPFSVIGQVAGINEMEPLSEYSKNKNILYFQTDALTIRNPDRAPLHIDGDPVETSLELKIRIIRNSIRLIQP